jgi:hypothetical protein
MPGAACALALVVLAQSNPALEGAQKAVNELRYPDARPLLIKARLTPNLDRTSLLEILWLQGLVNASLGQADAARTAFRALLSIEPDYTPRKELPPKVMTPFYEAKGWVATTKPLRMTAQPPERQDGRVRRIGLRVSADPMSLVVGVKFHVLGQPDSRVELKGGAASREVDGEEVSWWAELVGEREAQLQLLGSAESPIVDRGADLVPNPEPHEGPVGGVEEPAGGGGGSKHTLAFVTLGIGGGTLIAGCIFGGLAASITGQLKNPTRDATGAITSLTQRQAFALDSQERTYAILANTLITLGIVVLVAGAALFFFGGS